MRTLREQRGYSKVRRASLLYRWMRMGLLRCFYCSEKAEHIHHFDWHYENNSSDNLLPICQPCHAKIHNKGFNWHPFRGRPLTDEELVALGYTASHGNCDDFGRRVNAGRLIFG